jgi:hypothetical protein
MKKGGGGGGARAKHVLVIVQCRQLSPHRQLDEFEMWNLRLWGNGVSCVRREGAGQDGPEQNMRK